MANDDHNPTAIEIFWQAFDQAWRDGGSLSAEELSDRLMRERHFTLSPSTIRDWMDHKRVPRTEEKFAELCLFLVGEERASELEVKRRSARRAQRAPRTQVTPDSTPPSTAVSPPADEPDQQQPQTESSGTQPTTGTSEDERQDDEPEVSRSWVQRHGWRVAAVAGVVGVAVISALAVLPAILDDEAPMGTATPRTSPSSGTDSGNQPDNPPCPTSTVRAESQKNRASATYCADRHEFLLSDDDSDGKSAILVIRVNGEERPAWFHTKGYETRSPDGELTRVPPRRIPVSLTEGDTAEFRVCFGQWNRERTYSENSCGDWTSFWPTS